MANSYNKIILVGNLGRDAELRATPQGKQVASSSLAVEDWQKKDDRGKPGTEWYKIKIWGRQAETLSPHLLKGKTILVEGRLSIQTWTDREGKTRYTPEVSADRVVLLGSSSGGGQGSSMSSRGENGPMDDEMGQSPDVNADDIPF
ncbi:MAG: single-stranded DNA-binding protein [Acidobacteriota bacterium]